MATRNPISTISYNSEAFLREKLSSWLEAHLIQSYMYIKHKGEDGDKDHIHLRIEPNKSLDPMNLSESLKEYVKDNSKPLGVRPWRPSKEEDWILYAVHDPEYLAEKYASDRGEKMPYVWSDVVSPDGFDVETAYIRAKQALKHSAPALMKRIQDGVKPAVLVSEGYNPFTMNAMYKLLHGQDYARLAAENAELRDRLSLLEGLLRDRGLVFVIDENGVPDLVARDRA